MYSHLKYLFPRSTAREGLKALRVFLCFQTKGSGKSHVHARPTKSQKCTRCFFLFNPLDCIRPSFLTPSYCSSSSDPEALIPHPRYSTTTRTLNFYPEKTETRSSLVDFRRVAPTHATKAALRKRFLLFSRI